MSVSPALFSCELCGGRRVLKAANCPYCGSRGVQTLEVTIPDKSSAWGETFSIILLVLPLLLVVAMMLVVLPTHALHSPVSRFWRVWAVSSILIAIAGIKDAAALGRVHNMKAAEAIHWFVYLLFGWPLMMPMYFGYRKGLGYPDRRNAARLVCSIAALATLLLFYNARREELAYRPPELNKPVSVVRDHWPVTHGHGPATHQHKM